jgi:hypothetical protein
LTQRHALSGGRTVDAPSLAKRPALLDGIHEGPVSEADVDAER